MVPRDSSELSAALERALAEPGWLEVDVDGGDAVAETVERFAAIADELLAKSCPPADR